MRHKKSPSFQGGSARNPEKVVIARNEAVSQLNGFVAAQLAARCVKSVIPEWFCLESIKVCHSRIVPSGIHNNGISSMSLRSGSQTTTSGMTTQQNLSAPTTA